MHLQQAFPFLAIISLLSLRTKVSLKFPQHLTPSSAVVACKSWSKATRQCKRVSSSDAMGNSRKYLFLTTDGFHVLTPLHFRISKMGYPHRALRISLGTSTLWKIINFIQCLSKDMCRFMLSLKFFVYSK